MKKLKKGQKTIHIKESLTGLSIGLMLYGSIVLSIKYRNGLPLLYTSVGLLIIGFLAGMVQRFLKSKNRD